VFEGGGGIEGVYMCMCYMFKAHYLPYLIMKVDKRIRSSFFFFFQVEEIDIIIKKETPFLFLFI